MRKNKMLMTFLLLGIFLCCVSANAWAGISGAAAYLEITQNADGSWGSDPATIYFETTEMGSSLLLTHVR